jgi:biopolymer transport protein ExbD
MPLKTTRDDAASVNLTPMIDIVFLLIIFFMVGTKFTELERKIGLQVPQVNNVGALTTAPERKVVSVYRDGTITLDRQEVSAEQLTERLRVARDEYADLGILVRGDADGRLQTVAAVLNACAQAGISKMGISVRLARQES